MATYQIFLGDTGDRGGIACGAWTAETPEGALLRSSRDADPTREYAVPALLSTSAEFGRSAERGGYDGAGNGGQDRSNWYYVSDDAGQFVGVYTVAEIVLA